MFDTALVLAVVLVAICAYRADFERYSILTVGIFKRVERTPVEGADYECAGLYCDDATGVAERRRWFKEAVIAGMPVLRYDGGVAYYCEQHVSFEIHDRLDEATVETSRLETTIGGAIAAVAWAQDVTEVPEESDESPFESTVSATSAAFELATVVVVVFVAAMVLGAVTKAAEDSRRPPALPESGSS